MVSLSRKPDPVQGYLFDCYSSGDPNLEERNNTVCKIVGRAEVSDSELLDFGVAFDVEFGDGFKTRAYSCELSPWYPT